MSKRRIRGVLADHGVETTEIGGRLHAANHYVKDGCPCMEWVEVEGWGLKQLLEWLGY